MNRRFPQAALPRQAIALLLAYALVLSAMLGGVAIARSGSASEICFGNSGFGRSKQPVPVKHDAADPCCLAFCASTALAILPAADEVVRPDRFAPLALAIKRRGQVEPPAKFVSARAPPLVG